MRFGLGRLDAAFRAPVLMRLPFAGGEARQAKVPTRRDLWIRLIALRLLAASLAAMAAVMLADAALAHWGPPTERVVVATADIGAGQVVDADAVSARLIHRSAAPEAALTAVDEIVGRRATAPILAGEILTSARLRSVDVRPGRRSVHLPLLDAGVVRWLHPGDHVDVRSADGGAVASDVVVVAIDEGESSSLVGESAAKGILVSVDEAVVPLLTRAAYGPAGGVAVALR